MASRALTPDLTIGDERQTEDEVADWQTLRDTLWATRLPDPHVGYSVAKRFIDVALAGAGLVAFAPVMAVCALLVKFTSPGSVLFRQERCGVGGRRFQVLKFRTMVADAEMRLADLSERARRGEFEAVDAPAFKSHRDPRVTFVGRILRRTCLDELPQLINVLRGDMSLIGPRPLVRAEAEAVPDYARVRLAVRPGLTCIWQTARTVSTTYEERMLMDAEYARTRSLRTDLRILLRTPAAILRGNGVF